ncbi:MAG: M20/M25/M40 family metallo-hydrolase [Planctomycetota bacterium]
MKVYRSLGTASLLLLFAACAAPAEKFVNITNPAAQDARGLPPELARIEEISNRTTQVKQMQEVLCLEIGPRLTGSSQLTKACEWAKAQFESYGLKATMEPWGEVPVGFDRGKLSGKLLEPISKITQTGAGSRPAYKTLDVGTTAWTAGTNGPAAGYAVLMPASADEVTTDPGKYKNTWVVRPAAARGARTDPSEPILLALEKAGVHGFVMIGRNDLILTSGNFNNIKWDALPTRVTVRIKKTDGDEITQFLKDGKEVKLEFNIENKFVKGPIPQYNVIADIPGTEFPDQYVVVGGHIDSWDGAQGATDNATGVVTTLEAARLLMKAGLKPRRTIRFMLWGGEEQGLLGSTAWLEQNKSLIPNISCALVHDEGTNYCNGLQVTPAIEALFAPALGALVNLNPLLPFEFFKVASLPVGIGSDHDAFLRVGIPGFFWVQQKGDVDYNFGHHTQNDNIDRVRYDYQKHSSIVIAYSAYQIANLNEMVPRSSAARSARGKRIGAETDLNLKIIALTENGVAAKAGLKEGDQIVKINNKDVAVRSELRGALAEVEGNKAAVVVLRDGKKVTLDVEWPAN